MLSICSDGVSPAVFCGTKNVPHPTLDSSAPRDPVTGLVLTQFRPSLLGSLIHPLFPVRVGVGGGGGLAVLKRILRLLDGHLRGDGRAKCCALSRRLSFKTKARQRGKNEEKGCTERMGGGRESEHGPSDGEGNRVTRCQSARGRGLMKKQERPRWRRGVRAGEKGRNREIEGRQEG